MLPIHRLDLGTGEVREQILFRAIPHNVQNKQGDQGQPGWLPERQMLLDQPDLQLGLGDLIQWMQNRLWVLTPGV